MDQETYRQKAENFKEVGYYLLIQAGFWGMICAGGSYPFSAFCEMFFYFSLPALLYFAWQAIKS